MSAPLSTEVIEELRRLEAEATNAPWRTDVLYWTLRFYDKSPDRFDIEDSADANDPDRNDAPFIVAMRNALPALLDHITTLTSDLATARGERDDLTDSHYETVRLASEVVGYQLHPERTSDVMADVGSLVDELRQQLATARGELETAVASARAKLEGAG